MYVNAKKTLIQSKRFGNKKSISCVSANNMKKKTGLNIRVNDFSVDYRAFDTSNIIDIDKDLMKKQYKIMFAFIEKNVYQTINCYTKCI